MYGWQLFQAFYQTCGGQERKTLNSSHKLGVVRPNTRLISNQRPNYNPRQLKTTTNQQENVHAQNKT